MLDTTTYPIPSPLGLMQASVTHHKLTELVFVGLPDTDYTYDSNMAPSDYPKVVADVAKQIQAYFEAPHADWLIDLANPPKDISYQLGGTPLYQAIWRAMQTIPIGETRTYGEVAAMIGTGPRVVGTACRTNAFALMIPCHRVVASNGLGGYYGKTPDGISLKSALLAWEQR